jgi:hypothetical protein
MEEGGEFFRFSRRTPSSRAFWFAGLKITESLLNFFLPLRGGAIGSTPDFGSGYPGSSPGPGAIHSAAPAAAWRSG